MAQVLDFPAPMRATQLTERLWMIRLHSTPESQRQADHLVEQLRANNYIVPEYMK